MKLIKSICFLVFSMFMFSACAPKPTYLELVLESSNNINPDINRVPSPLVVSFYELKYAENFSKYDYWVLMEDENKNLKSDLISQAKHIITPNKRQTYKILLDDKTKYLGVVANFKDIQTNEKWKYLIELKMNDYNFKKLEIDNYNIKSAEKLKKVRSENPKNSEVYNKMMSGAE